MRGEGRERHGFLNFRWGKELARTRTLDSFRTDKRITVAFFRGLWLACSMAVIGCWCFYQQYSCRKLSACGTVKTCAHSQYRNPWLFELCMFCEFADIVCVGQCLTVRKTSRNKTTRPPQCCSTPLNCGNAPLAPRPWLQGLMHRNRAISACNATMRFLCAMNIR